MNAPKSEMCFVCYKLTPTKYSDCEEPCRALIAYDKAAAEYQVNRDAQVSAEIIALNNEREELRGEF